jgi:T5orf172 domain/Domain of unknown function (DUF4268)
MATPDGGYVYIMTNRTMPGLVKIGSTKLAPEERARQLSTTGVPAPFEVIAFYKFEDELHAERELHAIFSGQRVHPRREFFELNIEEAQSALLRLSDGKLERPTPDSIAAQESAPEREPRPTSYTSASVLGFPYWTRFNDVRVERNSFPRFENAGPRFFHRYFLVRPSRRNGNRNIHYEGRIRIKDPQVSMRVIFKTAEEIKELFDLIEQDREKIEQELGFSLQWMRDAGRHEAHIAIERDDLDPRNVGEWQLQHTWLSDVVSGFEKAIRPLIARLPTELPGRPRLIAEAN